MVRRGALAVVFVMASALVGVWADDPKHHGKERPKNETFEQLKKLAGKWTGKGDCMGRDEDVTVIYKVTSAGSAVMETIFPGTDHEMVTLYTVDGDKVVLTHYCALGNQPRLQAEKTDKANKIAFKFVGGTNLNPAEDMHMHEGTMEWLGADHIKSEWTAYHKGKPAGGAKIELRRQKSE